MSFIVRSKYFASFAPRQMSHLFVVGVLPKSNSRWGGGACKSRVKLLKSEDQGSAASDSGLGEILIKTSVRRV